MPLPSPFARRGTRLHCEAVDLAEVAERFGTPTYVYSRAGLLAAWRAYADAFAGRDALVCFAVKANPNLGVLDVLARAGSGFDIVSGGELARVLAAGGDPRRIVFSGVGKSAAEVEAALRAGILCFNVESAAELEQVDRVARAVGRRAPVSLRVNPDVDARTHPHISTGLRDNKFGIAWDDAVALYREAAAHAGLEVVGIDCHIGSQIVQLAPYLDAADRLLDLLDRLQAGGIRLRHIDFGGGLGIAYRDEQPPAVAELIAALLARVDAHGHGDKRLIVEPGRSIAGPAGVLLTRANLLKPGPGRHFVVVDAAMNDLLRPAMYGAWMAVEPVQAREDSVVERVYDVVGPVCESADCLARDRRLRITAGDLLVVRDAGAYGMSMAGNYNSRPRAAEVMVDGDRVHLVRRRETFADLIAGESRLPDPP